MKQPKVLIQHEDIHFLVFTKSVTPSINTPRSSRSFMISIIHISIRNEQSKFFKNWQRKSSEQSKSSTLAANFLPIFCSNLFIALDVTLLTNPGKLSLAKEITAFVSTFLPKNQKVHQIELF